LRRKTPSQSGVANERASEPTRAEWGSRGPARARLRQGFGEVSPERFARRRKRVGGVRGVKPLGKIVISD
jgi:hypothetical protein